METGDEKLALSVTAVARLLGISRNRMYDLIAENEIPHIRLGHRIIVPRAALDEWLATASKGTAPYQVPVPGGTRIGELA